MRHTKPVITALQPIHHSRHRRYQVIRANNMDSIPITDEQRVAMESICLGIFTDMTNAGASLQQSLVAIYVTGLNHAREISADKDKETPQDN